MSGEVKNWRVRCAWGDGSTSYQYFSTQEQASNYHPDPKPNYGVFSGLVIGHKNPRSVTIQQRGPRGGWATCPAPEEPGQ